MDAEANSYIRQFCGKQNISLMVYRAIPKAVNDKSINGGDWVSIVKAYAIDHGITEWGKGNYKILKKRVHARDIFTCGDSWLEWGYDPQPENVEYTKNRKKEIAMERLKRLERGEKIIGYNKYPTDPWFGKDMEMIIYLKSKL